MTETVERLAEVECPECGHTQGDMGNGVACEECGALMPTNAPPGRKVEEPVEDSIPGQAAEEDAKAASLNRAADGVEKLGEGVAAVGGAAEEAAESTRKVTAALPKKSAKKSSKRARGGKKK